MKTINVYRQGDLGLIPNQKNYVVSLPKDLKKADTNIIMQGSGGHAHKVENCEIYFKNVDMFIFGYLKAGKDAKVLHKEHGIYIKGKPLKEGKLLEGIYQLRHQVEFTQDSMRVVVD